MRQGESISSSDPVWKFAGQDAEFQRSLSEVHASVRLPESTIWWRRLLAFVGPGYLISVGYMDPGNWATDIAGGSQFGYALLSVIMLSNLMAILLQALAARLGIATGRDLAQACRDSFPRSVNVFLWLACEVAIVACDLAEVIGTAIALQLLFGIPLVAGAVATGLDALLVLLLMKRGFRFLEAFVAALLGVILICFVVQVVVVAPPIAAVVGGFVPKPQIVTNGAMLYLAISIVGATVMPHNLYLHSSIVQSRDFARDEMGRREAIRWSTVDGTLALMLALFVNAAILIVSAAVFHTHGRHDVTEIGEAFRLLSPLLGVGIASTLFAVALLASGLNSTLTATLAGQIVMEGFLRLRLAAWARRLLTRAVAIVPVVVVIAVAGERGATKLLVLSQVILSMQLPFAIVPMVMFVSDRARMGPFAISRGVRALAWSVVALILVLDVKVLIDAMGAG